MTKNTSKPMTSDSEDKSNTWSRPNHGGKLMPQPESGYKVGDEIKQAQSEAPSVDEILGELLGRTSVEFMNHPNGKKIVMPAEELVNYLNEAKAKINRLIDEAQRLGIQQGARETIKLVKPHLSSAALDELSNNLSKEDV